MRGKGGARWQRDLSPVESVEEVGDGRGGQGALGQRVGPGRAGRPLDDAGSVGGDVGADARSHRPAPSGKRHVGGGAQRLEEGWQGGERRLGSAKGRQDVVEVSKVVGEGMEAFGLDGERGVAGDGTGQGEERATGMGVEVEARRQGVDEGEESGRGIGAAATGPTDPGEGDREGGAAGAGRPGDVGDLKTLVDQRVCGQAYEAGGQALGTQRREATRRREPPAQEALGVGWPRVRKAGEGGRRLGVSEREGDGKETGRHTPKG